MMRPPKPLTAVSNAAAWQNRLRSFGVGMRPSMAMDQQLWATTKGVAHYKPPAIQAGGGGEVIQAKIKIIQADYLQCVEWDGTNEGNPVNIARPYYLRQTPFHGLTVSLRYPRLVGSAPYTVQWSDFDYTFSYLDSQVRKVSIGTVSEHQFILLPYAAEQVIIASKVKHELISSEHIEYIDLNTDARFWVAF